MLIPYHALLRSRDDCRAGFESVHGGMATCFGETWNPVLFRVVLTRTVFQTPPIFGSSGVSKRLPADVVQQRQAQIAGGRNGQTDIRSVERLHQLVWRQRDVPMGD